MVNDSSSVSCDAALGHSDRPPWPSPAPQSTDGAARNTSSVPLPATVMLAALLGKQCLRSLIETSAYEGSGIVECGILLLGVPASVHGRRRARRFRNRV